MEKEKEELQEIEAIHIEPDQEFINWWHSRIIIPISTYEKFMVLAENERIWTDAFIIYCHLYYTARLQKTNRVWANRNYLMNAFHWGPQRLQKAILWLKENDFISISEQKKWNNNGRYGKVYIKIRYIPRLPVVLNDTTDKVKKYKEIEENRCTKCDNANSTTKLLKFKRNSAVSAGINKNAGSTVSNTPERRITSEEATSLCNCLFDAVGIDSEEANRLRRIEKYKYRFKSSQASK